MDNYKNVYMDRKQSFVLHVFQIACSLKTVASLPRITPIKRKISNSPNDSPVTMIFHFYYSYKFDPFDQLTFPLEIMPANTQKPQVYFLECKTSYLEITLGI